MIPQHQYVPPLPDWLESLLAKPYSLSNSLKIDRWLNYVSLEFEGVDRG